VRVSAFLLLVAAGAAGLVVGLAYGTRPGLETASLLVLLGVFFLGLAHVLAGRRMRLGPLRRQFGLGVGVAVSQLLAATVAFSVLMFVSTQDAVLIVASVAFAGLVAVRAAQLFAKQVLGDVETVRDGLVAVGEGRREVRLETGGCDEVAELAEAANTMVARLAATERARRDLVMAVSHDLRTPLTSLRLLGQAIEDEVVDGPTRDRYLATMATHIEALGVLIDDLFELSRLEAGDIEWTMERIPIDRLVRESVGAMRVTGDASRVRVVAEVPAEGPLVRANPERLRRVLFNLIQNAIRHTPADGSVTVRAEPGDGLVEIEVADTGTGIPATDRERVFEAFFRSGEDESRNTDGSGLGLAIARGIVEAHGGRIWLAPSTVGTRVRFSLPAA
jgi:signal transduction histidine kinase